jgi:hypothetical protein
VSKHPDCRISLLAFWNKPFFHGVRSKAKAVAIARRTTPGIAGIRALDLVSGFLPNSTLFAPNYLFQFIGVFITGKHLFKAGDDCAAAFRQSV